MSRARALYHRLVPPTVRNPFGMARRQLQDRLLRATTRPPLPPRELLANIQLTPFVMEYLDIGRRSAASISEEIRLAFPVSAPLRLLDFGCGSARTLRHFLRRGWELSGCDIDREAVVWAQRNIPELRLTVNSAEPPLPYGDDAFDVVVAVSLFTHFDATEQQLWRDEIARVVRPGGIALISTMGPGVLPNFPAHATPDNVLKLQRDGFVFLPQKGGFNAQGAFHTLAGLRRWGGDELELLSFHEQGLDGFQDLSVYIRRK